MRAPHHFLPANAATNPLIVQNSCDPSSYDSQVASRAYVGTNGRGTTFLASNESEMRRNGAKRCGENSELLVGRNGGAVRFSISRIQKIAAAELFRDITRGLRTASAIKSA